MVSPLAVPFNPDMTEEERIAQQEENNRQAAEFSKEFYSRLQVPMFTSPISGFRGVPQPVYQSTTPGFRSTSMVGDIPLITGGPLVTDYTDMSNYTPTYEELPVYDVTTNTYVPEHSGREDDGFDPGSTIIGYEDSAGNPILDSSGKNWNDRDGFTQDDSVDASDSDDSFGGGWGGGFDSDDGGDYDDSFWSDGGKIPPVYANRGDAIPTYEDLVFQQELAAQLEQKKKEEEAAKGTKSTGNPVTDLTNFGKGMYNQVIEPGVDFFTDKVNEASKNPAEVVKNMALTETIKKGLATTVPALEFLSTTNPLALLVGGGINYALSNKAPTVYPNQKGIDPEGPPVTGLDPSFDPSPGTINPMTGDPRRPEDDTIPGGTIPDVNISLTRSGDMSLPKSMVDVYNASQAGNYPTATGLAPISSGPMVDSYTNIDAIQAYKEEFAAAQEAKREAAIQAVQDQIAAAIAASNSNYNDTSPGDDDWDERTGAQAVKDAGGPDRTKGGVDSFYNKGGLVYAHEGTNLLGETKLNNDNYLAFPQRPSVDPIPLSLREFLKEKQEERLNARSDVGYDPGPREEIGRGESDEGYRRTIFDHPAFVDESGRPMPTDFEPKMPIVNDSFSDHPAFADESGRPTPTRNSKIYGPGGK